MTSSGHVRRLDTADQLNEAVGIRFSDEQLAAITAPLEPGVIIAGAGSGKTTVMAARVVWLVGSGQVRPDQVLGLTFTRKAAAELSARVAGALIAAGVTSRSDPDETGQQSVMTYDSFASRLVSDHGMRIGVETDPTMITGAQRYRLAAQVVADAPGPFQSLSRLRPVSITERVLRLDSDMTSHLVGAAEIEEQTRAFLAELGQAPLWRGQPYKAVQVAEAVALERLELLGLVSSYQARKRELGVVEFADQMATAADLVRRVPLVGARLREQFGVVLLDEYQDTSAAQADLLRGLFSGPDAAHGRGHPVTAVGDPFQAIYGWRGAAASNIMRFAGEFARADGSAASSFTLTVNRRSGPRILDVGNALAAPLRQDPLLAELVADRDTALTAPKGTPRGHVLAAEFQTWAEEIDWVADRIVSDLREQRVEQYSQIAVLLRRNADIAPLFTALSERDVPCEIVGLGGLLRLGEVAEVVSTLRLLLDVTANPEVVRLLSGPRWRVGPRDLAALGLRARELAGRDPTDGEPDDLRGQLDRVLGQADPTQTVCLLEAVGNLGAAPVSATGRARMQRFGAELIGLRSHLAEPTLDLVRRVIATLGVEVELAASPRGADRASRAQLAAFVAAVADYADVDGDGSLAGLIGYLDAELEHGVGLDQATPSEQNSVKLLTVHKAKGLEWDVVYLPSLVEKVFPSDRVTDNWVTSPGVLPAELRGDADSIPQVGEASKQGFDSYADDLKRGQLHAEDRLAYVAATRARRTLIGSAHHWRSGMAKQRPPSGYFAEIRARAREDATVLAQVSDPPSTNPQTVSTCQVPWPGPIDAQALAQRRESASLVDRFASTGAKPAEATTLDDTEQLAGWHALVDCLVEQAVSGPAAVELPRSMSATALMTAHADPQRFAADLIRPMPRKPSEGARVGTRFHSWVERHYGLAPTLDEADDDLPVPDKDDEKALRRMIEAFRAGPYAALSPVAIEVPFVLVLGQQLLRGRIDAVFAATGPEYDYQVVDWKTYEGAGDPIQLGLYRLAWAQAHDVAPERVDAVFYHVHSGQVERPRSIPDPAGLAGILSGLVDG